MVKKRCCFLWMIAGIGLVLNGCSATELEERCFPMMVSVGYQDRKVTFDAEFPKEDESGQGGRRGAEEISFEQAKIAYENRLNRDADYNHLKVLVLEEDLLEQKDVYEDMLESLMYTEDFPRNTYVCVVDEVEELEEMEKSISQDMGTYLEEYLKKQEEKKNRLLTLGDLMDEKENQAMVLYLPYLEVEEKFIEWKGYVNISGKNREKSILE